ncbi:hypothetical protein, partial [Flavobacterium sp.]|uniref:hypothetical protein n=1 Tax=Flavobacterium sp. TaxID=239 RepID=UPI002608A1C1
YQIAPIVVEIKIVFSLKTTFIATKAGKQNTEMHKTIAHEKNTNYYTYIYCVGFVNLIYLQSIKFKE